MKKNTEKPRVFCVGWHKTGTTTMGEALLLLGYKVVGARLDLATPLLAGNTQEVIDLAQQFDAFQDVPWAALYQELDEAYPGSKFILT
ncbi:MAG: sulfotransferase, partial [Bacteroidota bacterium]